MATKLSLAFLAAFVILQFLTWQSQAIVVRRDVPEKNASQAIDDALQSFKSGLDDLVKNIQGNELFQNVSERIRQFGETIQHEGQQLVNKIQTETKSKN